MKVIIAGGRNVPFEKACGYVRLAIKKSAFHITEIVSGNAVGIDMASELYGSLHNIPVRLFPADWGTHGRSAGPIRNGKMAQYGEALVAIWDGRSPGTKNMIERATKLGLKVFVYRIDNEKVNHQGNVTQSRKRLRTYVQR